MSNLIDDGSLVGLWPLHEPSGTPTFKNYSPARAGFPSGISFDMHVATFDANGTADNDSMSSPWPGGDSFIGVSGNLIRGYKVQGAANIITNQSSPLSKGLILGAGTRATRSETLGPIVAQSGFTAGIWVYPLTNGWLTAFDDGGFSTATDSWFTGYGRIHPLMGQFSNDIGWYLGVSGSIDAATPQSASFEGGLPQLRAYLLADRQAGVPPEISTPIESGRWTHLTMSYRFVTTTGISNETVLYKDGRVEGSGLTNTSICFDATNTSGPDSKSFTIGATRDGGDGTDNYEFAGGFGHMVSGAYVFRRVLDEGEVLALHECGGLQPDLSLRDNATEVSLFDDHLVAFIEGRSAILVDATKNRHNFLTETDVGPPATTYTTVPGPNISTGGYGDGNNLADSVVAPSGACFALATAPAGFTICGMMQPSAFANDRDGNMMMSWGSVSTATTGGATATVTGNTMGLVLTYFFSSPPGDRVTLEVFPVGDFTDGDIDLRMNGEQLNRHTMNHFAIVYDAGSQGIALYVDGHIQESGTLTHDLQAQLLRVAGSGFPIMFMNGVTNQIVDTTTKGVHSNGGDNSAFNQFALFSRPLRADELRFMAASGIKTDALWKTRQDPRLMGYWPCTDYDIGDIVVPDVARTMGDYAGHLTRGHSFNKWERVYDQTPFQSAGSVFRNDGTAFIDLFGPLPTQPPELAGFGNLGITSGTFEVMGNSKGAGAFSLNSANRNSPVNLFLRYIPAPVERDSSPQSLNEYILSFEVTPSGNIPPLDASSWASSANQRWFNNFLTCHGNLGVSTSDGEFRSFLTTVNQSSGVIVGFTSRDGTTAIEPLISGQIPFGVPSKILFHMKFLTPYDMFGFNFGTAPMQLTLYVDGAVVNKRDLTALESLMWTDQAIGGTSSDWTMHFGGYASADTQTTNVDEDSGLGEIFMREIFLMRGIFGKGEVEALATSGILDTAIAGYNTELATTQVTLADSALEGYWRFNGFDGNQGEGLVSPGGSGTTDLSGGTNHLDAMAQRYYETVGPNSMAETQRALPGPFRNSTLGVQCSGFHNNAIRTGNLVPDMLPRHAVSGSVFDNPADGFSVGFFLAWRQAPINNTVNCLMCYGEFTDTPPNGTIGDTDLYADRGWAIMIDDIEHVKMVISTGGAMYVDSNVNAAYSGQIVCRAGAGGSNPPDTDGRQWNGFVSDGAYQSSYKDMWSHYCWTYDPTTSGVTSYINGQKMNERFIPGPADLVSPWTGGELKPQTPDLPEARMITMGQHMAAGPNAWDFRQNSMQNVASVLTDVFYFSRALAEEEVRYISQNGIDEAVGIPTSGIIGGYIAGQDTASGIIAGYVQGQDTVSGIMGGFMDGAIRVSGIIGGYVSGVVFLDGTIGGYVQGLETGSGIIGGYMLGSEVASGIIGGYVAGQDTVSGIIGGYLCGAGSISGLIGGLMFASDQSSGIIGGFALGGLSGRMEFDGGFIVQVMTAEDFDSQIQVSQTTNNDFDARVIIIEDECPPIVAISTPDAGVSGLAIPFNQYFVGKASGEQDKAIVKTRWDFGDFTPPVEVAESGAGCYPVQHQFTGSGFYIVRFAAIDENGISSSALRVVNAASGIDPVLVTVSGVPQAGNAELVVDFTTKVESNPGVSIISQLLTYDDGQTSTTFNPTHGYTEPGVYKPIWCVRDSRGVTWCDSIEPGVDFFTSGGG